MSPLSQPETLQMALNPEHLADAYVHIARIDHYLVGIPAKPNYDELRATEQILIERDNATNNADTVLNFALDLIEHDIKHAISNL